LKKFANAYSIAENGLKHETLLANNLIRNEQQLHTSLEHFISLRAPYKDAFDCLHMGAILFAHGLNCFVKCGGDSLV